MSSRSLLAPALIAFCACATSYATTAPSDPCSLLPAAQVSKILGRTYGPPQSSTAPRPYANTVQGTDCNYSATGAGKELQFRIYFDHSPSEATDLHARLKFFYSPPTAAPGVGDEAYFDPSHGLHVRKGNVRFYLTLGKDITPATQQLLIQLATLVAGEV